MLNLLKEKVYESNLELLRRGVVIYTWGNVSAIDRENSLVVIKPSGVKYSEMQPEDMVVVDLKTGETVEGKMKPSSDTKTHLALYKAFPEIGGVAHTHSINAVSFAQAGVDIPALGTTHADYFYGSIPCTRGLTEKEVWDDYELNTGKVIVECITKRALDPLQMPGIVVKNHGPFSWGKNAEEAVHNCVVMEYVADMAYRTMLINSKSEMPQYLLDKHYTRKHGVNSYYGQK